MKGWFRVTTIFVLFLLCGRAAGAQWSTQSERPTASVPALALGAAATPSLADSDSGGRSTGSLIAHTAVGALLGAAVSIAAFYHQVGRSGAECICMPLPPANRVVIGAAIGAVVGYVVWRLDR